MIFKSILKRIKQVKKPKFTKYQKGDPTVLQCCIAYNEYGGYCVPVSSYHRPAAQKILKGKVYEKETIDYIVSRKRHIKGDIIHAGTYFGDFLPALAKSCVDDEKVWAFEPNPENYRCALITTIINDLRNVVLMNFALGAENKSCYIEVTDEKGKALGGGSKVAKEVEKAQEKFLEVKMVRMDKILPDDRKIAVIHLDVEGYEKDVLTAGMEIIKRNKPVLILEDPPERDWLEKNIFHLGYKPIEKICGNVIFYIK